MKKNILHPLLGSDKSNPLFEILIDPKTPEKLLVHFAMHHLETVIADSFEEKLLVARLYNSDFSRKRLQETFGFDRKTMQSWGKALKSGKPEQIQKIFFGQGPEPKLFPIHISFIKKKYHELIAIHGCHTNTRIRKELKDTFQIEVCRETIRTITVKEKNAAEQDCNELLEYPVVKYSDEVKMANHISTLFDRLTSNHIIRSCSTEGKQTEHLVDCEKAAVLKYPIIRYSSELQVANHISSLFQQLVKSHSVKDSAPRENIEKRESTGKSNPVLSLETSKNSKYFPSPRDRCVPAFPTVKRIIEQPFLCHHAGLILCRLLIDQVTDDIPENKNVIRQWICMILCKCKNIENGQKLNYEALEFLIGKQLWSAFRQREKLHDIASEDTAAILLRRNILLVNAEFDDTFLYDPHSVGYTGRLKTLLGWLGSSHKVGKAYYQDFIHTTDGTPIFLDLDDNYYDMRKRFIDNIYKFRKLLSGDQQRALTIVVDRAIYDVEYMRELRDKHNIFIITWEKNYKKGQWDDLEKDQIKTIFIVRYKNSKNDTITYRVEYIKQPWCKDITFSQFTILLSKPDKPSIELSVICADNKRSSEDTLRPILRRWLQENDFMFLIAVGINEITSYKSCSYHEIADGLEDREIANKARKKLCAIRMKKKKELGLELVALEDFIEEKKLFDISINEQIGKLDSDTKRKQEDDKRQKLETDRKKLNKEIKNFAEREKQFFKKSKLKTETLRQQIKKLDDDIGIEPMEVSRLESILESEYRKLNFMPKTLMDCVKVTARNIIYKLLEEFRPLYDNFRNDIVILNELIMSTGYIKETSKTIIISLYPSRQYSQSVKKVIVRFLMKLSYKVNSSYLLDKVIIFDLYTPKNRGTETA